MLAEHNSYRGRHRAGALTADANVRNVAQGWANYLASVDGGLVHNNNAKLGENIASSTSSGNCRGNIPVYI